MPGAVNMPPFIEPAVTTQQAVDIPDDQRLSEVASVAEKQPDNRPPWEKSGEPFDPQRAWNLTQNLRQELAAYKAQAQPILDEHERLRRASQTELDRANEDIGALTTERDTWRARALRADAKELAARFIDTDAALALIGDLSAFTGPDGLDKAQLIARLDQLAAEKPHLVAAAPKPPGFTPNRAQSQAGTGGGPLLDELIAAAEKSGDFAASIALKQQRYHQNQNRS
ncbi:MAG: hypothetical protein K2Q25_02395 [Mycobacteriaceae bacterium]|nr:hypothetical protein [Mycobacteriaceae bacterium]